MATEKRLIGYYVVRNKTTGFYFRGKGANRWGEYHNQASIYRIRAQAENTAKWLNLRGEPVEIVPIQIVENPTDIVEVVRCKDCKHTRKKTGHEQFMYNENVCICTKEDIWGITKNEPVWDDGFCSYGERRSDG